jgi:SAM-dependent methyltransferase
MIYRPKHTPNISKDIRFKYALYENAVQTPAEHCDLFALMYADIVGKSAHILREDFCGTYAISSYWTRRHKKNIAICLDLDPEPLSYGWVRNQSGLLTTEQRSRVKPMLKNVISVTAPKADLAIACNFSFYILKKRPVLIDYFRSVYRSLKKGGMFALEITGGPGMIETHHETRTIKPAREKGVPSMAPLPRKYTYFWDQKSFNPINCEGLYAIHFKVPGKPKIKDAFVYDWRVWTIPEIRECLAEAGFQKTICYWEMDRSRKKERTLAHHEYGPTEVGENYYTWIAYVAAIA